jgi:hypothetical protein
LKHVFTLLKQRFAAPQLGRIHGGQMLVNPAVRRRGDGLRRYAAVKLNIAGRAPVNPQPLQWKNHGMTRMCPPQNGQSPGSGSGSSSGRSSSVLYAAIKASSS